MKKISVIALSFLFVTSGLLGNTCYRPRAYYVSQSFMLPRPITQSMPTRFSALHNVIHEKHGENLSALQLTGMFQHSISQPETARYFLFDGKTELLVAGDSSTNQSSRDIRAEWLNLPADFSGRFSINPEQKQLGFVVEYNQNFSKFTDNFFLKDYWVSIEAPVVAVSNDLHFKQFDIEKGTATQSGPKDLTEAFNQKDWYHGKINGRQSTLTIAHIKATLGKTYMSEKNFQIAYYSHLLFATAAEDNSKYLFDAVAGSNGHHGLGSGINFQIVLNRENEKYDICFFSNFEHTFFFSKRQKRMLDLKDKPWSRYLLLNKQNGGINQNIPAINVLTQYVNVRPYSTIDFACGWRVKTKQLEIEVGYNLWAHGSETLEWRNKFDTTRWDRPGFEEIYGIAAPSQTGDTTPRSASQSTISTFSQTAAEEAGSDYSFETIKEEDVCLKTGANRGAINHRIYASVQKIKKGKKIDANFELGAFYEIAQRNSALNSWGLWATTGTAF